MEEVDARRVGLERIGRVGVRAADEGCKEGDWKGRRGVSGCSQALIQMSSDSHVGLDFYSIRTVAPGQSHTAHLDLYLCPAHQASFSGSSTSFRSHSS